MANWLNVGHLFNYLATFFEIRLFSQIEWLFVCAKGSWHCAHSECEYNLADRYENWKNIFNRLCMFLLFDTKNMWRRDTKFRIVNGFFFSFLFFCLCRFHSYQSFFIHLPLVFFETQMCEMVTHVQWRSHQNRTEPHRRNERKTKRWEREKELIWLHHKNRKCARHQTHELKFDLNESRRVSVCLYKYVHVNLCGWRDDYFALMKRTKKNYFFFILMEFFFSQFTTRGTFLEEGIGSNEFHWLTILKIYHILHAHLSTQFCPLFYYIFNNFKAARKFMNFRRVKHCFSLK